MSTMPDRATSYLGEKLSLSPDEIAVAHYGLQMLILSVANLAALLLAGFLLGCLAATAAVLLVSAALRSFSGGAHSSSPLRCLFFSSLAVPALGKLALLVAPMLSLNTLWTVIAAGLVVSLPVVWCLAPVDSPAKPITSPRHRRNLHRLSVAFVPAVALLQGLMLYFNRPELVLAMACGLLWQVFSLTKTGHRSLAGLDRLLSYNLIKRR